MARCLGYFDTNYTNSTPSHFRLPQRATPLSHNGGEHCINFLRAVEDHAFIYPQHFGVSAYLIGRMLPKHHPIVSLSGADLIEPELKVAPLLRNYLARVRVDEKHALIDEGCASEEDYYPSVDEATEAYEIAKEMFTNVTVFKYQRAYSNYERQKELRELQDANLHTLILQNCAPSIILLFRTKYADQFYATKSSGIALVKLILTSR